MTKEEKFKQTLAEDARRFQIGYRYGLAREATFLVMKAIHRLQRSEKYYDCSKDPDYDDLTHNVTYALQFLEFAQEELQEIADRDWQLEATPQQYYEKSKKAEKKKRASKKKVKREK